MPTGLIPCPRCGVPVRYIGFEAVEAGKTNARMCDPCIAQVARNEVIEAETIAQEAEEAALAASKSEFDGGSSEQTSTEAVPTA